MADILSRFRSLSRPSLSRSTSTGAFSSYAKKQQSAEDAIIDNQYEAGVLSPEAYLSSLNARLARSTNTPLANVNLQEKIVKVQEKVSDAQISNQYASGKLTTKEVLSYEQQKLSRMTEPNNPAYQAQQQKVVQLQNKAEREDRASYRTAEMMRLAQMPDDSSAKAWEKAQIYQTLSDQARLDGDTQQADQLATQAMNYTAAAKKADVNDRITQARLSVSETTGAGLGTPSAEGGISRLFGSSPTSGGATGGGGPQGESSGSTASPSVTTGYSGIRNTATNNIFESIDRKYMNYERTVQQINDTNSMIAAYQSAIAESDGDQKTQLTIALNNLVESRNTKQNQLDILESGINEDVARLQEVQAKAAASSFTQEVRKNDKEFAKIEDQLEKAFSKGEITKEEYIQKGVALAATKAQFYGQSSDVFNQYGNDSNAQSYLDKAAQMEEVHQNLIGVAENLDSYEPIATDPGGKVTNLFGKGLQVGDIALVNVQRLKDSGDFDVNYTLDNGVYKRIYYPGQESVVGDGYISKSIAEELSKNATDPDKMPFVYGTSTPPGGIGPTTGKVEKQPLVKTTTGEFVTSGTYNEMKETANQSLDKVLGKTNETTKLINQIKKTETQGVKPGIIDRLFKPLSEVPVTKKEEKGNLITSAIGNALSGVKDWFGGAVNKVKEVFGQSKDQLAGASQNVGLPPLVKKAKAVYTDTTDDQIRKWAERAEAETGVSADLIIAQYKLESGSGKSAPGNNYFGMKGTGPAGSQRLLTTENVNGKNVKVYQNFRKYNTPEESFIDHARLLSKDPRYKEVIEASKTGDKGAVADAIGRSPYATDPNYGKKIRELMGLDSSGLIASTENVLPDGREFPGGIAGPVMTTNQTNRTTDNIRLPLQPKAPDPIKPYVPPVGKIEINMGSSQPPQSPTTQPGKSFVKDVFKPAVQNVQKWVAPKVEAIKQAAAPVVQNVQKNVSTAVSNVKNWLSSINPFKKK